MAVIYADVVTRLDERAAKAAADQLEKQFAEVTAKVGNNTSDGIGESLTSALRGHGDTAGANFMEGLRTGITGEIGGVTGTLTNRLSEVTTAMRGIGAGGAAAGVAAAAGLAAVTVAAVKVGEALYGVGERFDAVFDGLAVRTGKAGDDLDALSESVRNVARTTASSIEQIGDIGGRISQSLDLSGSPLEGLTKQVADLNRMTGESLDIRRFGMTLRGFGEDGAKAGERLDELAAATQRTGIPLNELVSTMGSLGPAARSLGLDFDDTAGLIVAFEKAGIDAGKTTAGLTRAANTFADNNIELKTGLADTITQIRGFIDSGNEAAAIDLAGKVFGNRAAQNFVDAIRQGKLSVDQLHDSLGDADGTISKLNDQTADWAEQWTILKNRVSDLAGELGGPLFNAANKALGVINSILTPQNAYPTTAPSWAQPGTPITPQNLPGLLGGPATSNQPNGLDSILLPSDQAVPGQVIPPWMDITGGPNGTPQDIAGALADEAKKAALPAAPQLPYAPGYGQPPAPGETEDQWRARMANMAAEHDLAEKRARLNQLESSGVATAEDIISAKNSVIDAEMRQWETQRRYLESRQQQLQAIELPYGEGYLAAPRPGQTASQYSAETSFLEAQRKTAQAAATYQQLQSSGTATASDLAEAHNKLIEAQRTEREQSLRLSEAYKETSKGINEITNQLDADFGVSKGLAGIADNITRFVANLALAPVMGALQGVQGANGGYDQKTHGQGLAGIFGLMGGMGSTGSTSSAPNFGAYTPMAYPDAINNAPATTPVPGGYAPLATPSVPMTALPSGMPSILNDTGSVASGPQSRNAAALIQQLWGDQLRGKIGGSRDNNTAKNTHDAGLAIDIPIGPDQMGLGDQINAWLQANAQQLGLKYSIWRDQGKNVDGGQFTVPGHQNHIDAQFNGKPGAPTGMPLSAPSGMSASGATPVYVVNMPGGGMVGGGASAYTSGKGAAAPAGLAGTSQSDIAGYIAQKAAAAGYSPAEAQAFVAQAIGESQLNPGAYGATTGDATGGASGIYQFTPGTWNQFGGGGDPLNAKDNIDAYFRLAEARDPGQGDMRSRLAQISVGGPAVPSNGAPWDSYMNQSRGLIGDRYGATPAGGGAGGGIGPGMAGLPQSIPGLGGLPGLPALPGLGGSGPAPGPAAPSQSVIGGRAYGQGQNASPGLGFGGGLIGLAGSAAQTGIMAAGLAGDASGAMGGGSAGAMVASAAAQIGIQELQRAVGAAGQYVGALAGGVLETFSLNDSALGDPSKSWMGKVLGAVTGVRPALPNAAGAKPGDAENANMAEAGKEPPPPLDAKQSADQKAADAAANGGQGGTTTNTVNNNVSVTNQGASEDYTGQVIQSHLGAQATAGQPR